MAKGITKKQPVIDQSARLAYEALQQLGKNVDANALAERIKRLDLGLPAEDEFSMLVSWLGQCRLIHKLDQFQAPPGSRGLYQVPDLAAVFEYEEKKLSVLIEVKTTEFKTLSWRPDYFDGLRNYGMQMGLPILVAWKLKPLGLWTLFELGHFTRAGQNYSITPESAMRESLMGILAGDFGVVIRQGVGLHFSIKKEEKLSERKTEDGYVEKWRMRVEDAYFVDGNRQRLKSIGRLWPFFLSAQRPQQQINDTHAHQSFVVETEEPCWVQETLALLFEFQAKQEEPLNWREILQNHQVPVEASEIRQVAQEGIGKGVVRCVLHLEPHTRPAFSL